MELRFEPSDWRPFAGASLSGQNEFKQRLLLTDVGVYDNLGLEGIWDRCKTVLVSDAGAPLDLDPDPPLDWTRQAVRVLDIVTEQTRALRRRKLITGFQTARNNANDSTETNRRGAYWSISTRIGDYQYAQALTKDSELTASLKGIRTRLNAFSTTEQGRLINWGYALADAAVQTWLETPVVCEAKWPVPEVIL